MDLFQTRYYRINRRLLCSIGQWPLQTQRERYFYTSMSTFLIVSIIIPKLIRFVEYFGDVIGMIRCVPILCLHTVCSCKFLNCSIHAKEMMMLFNRIRVDRMRRRTALEDNILIGYAEWGRQLTIAHVACTSAVQCIFLSLPVFSTILDMVKPLNYSRRIKIYETEYFIDPDENFLYIWIHACIAMPFAIIILLAYDTMMSVYVLHVCGIFAALGARLESLGRSSTDDELRKGLTSHRDDKTYNDITTCIKLHKEAVEFAAFIETWSYGCSLIVVGATIVVTTLLGYITVTNLDTPSEVLRSIAFAMAAIIHMLHPCWHGQVLMEHSQSIFRNAYNVDWYEISPRAKKLLILMMLRSAKPCKLTAGKMFDLSIVNFVTALKTSISYFTVLLSIQ